MEKKYKFIIITFCLFVIYGAETRTLFEDTVQTQNSEQAFDRKEKVGGVDTVINYSAEDSIVYSLSTRIMQLYKQSQMQYQTIELKSERIDVNWDNTTLYAYGVVDTANQETTIGKPIMKDGGDVYNGDKVMYNFRTKKGKVTLGKTNMESGFYRGEKIKKVEADVLCVENGIYTTCDDNDPHFYFASPKMKVFVRDKVVAEPIFLYVADVPVFALPFGVFPAHGGRSSGIIAPAYGEDTRFGWYLTHFGYFWAVSDYWDIATMFDIYSRGRWRNQTNVRYKLRYNFEGSISASITDSPQGEPTDPDYSKHRDYYFNLAHNQTITPTSRLDANFTFMSGSYFKNYSMNYEDVFRQNVVSNATYSKNWESSNNSLSIGVQRDQNLVTGELNELLPRISFRQGTVFPFRAKTKTRGLTFGSTSEPSFIEMLGFDYNIDFSNNRSKSAWSDTVKLNPEAEQMSVVSDYKRTNTQSLSQRMSFSISPKFGYFTVSPSLSLSDDRSWTETKSPVRNEEDSLKIYIDNKDKNIAGRLSAGVSTSTKLYGIVQPNIFGVKAIRHMLTPTFSVFYNKQIYGYDMRKYSMVGSLNINNNFEMKYQKNDSAQTEEKVQLLNASVSTSYNFAADSMGFSPVNISFNTDIARALSISGGATYNLYMYDYELRKRVDKLLINEKGRFGDLTSFSFRLSTSFRGEKKQKPSETGIPNKVLDEQGKVSSGGFMRGNQRKPYSSIYDREEADFSIPWNISISYSFSQSQAYPGAYISRMSSISGSLSFNLTEKWQISLYGLSYDFVRKQHYIPSISITRDLHCWQMSFSWSPMGMLEGYRFELRVKAPQLQDIKVTKQQSVRGLYGN